MYLIVLLLQEIQQHLRRAIAWWAGFHRAVGRPDSEIYRRFYLAFGVDVLSAQALNIGPAEASGVAVESDDVHDDITAEADLGVRSFAHWAPPF